MAKDTIYIDIDDEITSVIHKMQASEDKVVALVLPKRATTFQSVINMKLLKKAAAAAQKSLVLITSDNSILPLAGAARLHVARSLQTKPSIPAAPSAAKEGGVISDDEMDELAAGDEVVAEGSAAAAALTDEVIELDNTDKLTKKTAAVVAVEAPKNRKLKVPNFNRFRIKVFLAVFAVILLIAGWIVGFTILPKAKILIKTDATTSEVSVPFTINTAAKTLDKDNKVIPATVVESKKTDTEKTPATGKQDQGTKATGTMNIYNCTDDDVTIPAGTLFSSSGYSFSLDEAQTVPASDFFSAANGGACKKNRSKVGNVTASQAGGNSNLSAGRDYSSNFASTITGSGSAMGGGTSKIVIVVSQEDINNAQAKLTGRQKSAASGDLKAQLTTADLVPIEETLDEAAPVFTANAAVGKEAVDVTVTAVTSYKMLGIKSNDLKTLVEATINASITNDHQKILDNGLTEKKLLVTTKKSTTEQVLSLTTSATVGPDIDTSTIAKDAAGKRKGDVITTLNAREGVKDVTITYSPFWVFQMPSKASKISVDVVQADAK